MELLGRYSNTDIVSNLQGIPAGQKHDRLPARTTRSLRKKQIQHRLNPEEVGRLLEGYHSGTKSDDLTTAFAINRNTVMEHARRAGAPRRRNVVTDHLDEARQLYDRGWSLAGGGQALPPAPTRRAGV